MTDHERAAAKFAADLAVDEIPDEVVDHVGLVMADTVGAIVGGSTDEAVAALAGRLASSTGQASILGTPHRAAVGEAALVNGTAGTVLELDEGHKYAAGHPAIQVLPALLAEAEVDDGPTDRFLVSFIAGYEVVTRVAEACYPLANGYHPHGVWGGASVRPSPSADTARSMPTGCSLPCGSPQTTLSIHRWPRRSRGRQFEIPIPA